MQQGVGLEFLEMVGNDREVVFAIDSSHRILAATSSLSAVLGYGANLLVGQHLVDLAYPDDHSWFSTWVTAERDNHSTVTSAKVETLDRQVRLCHMDGSFLLFEVTRRDLLTRNGFIVVTARNVTEQERLASERLLVAQRFLSMAASAPIAIYRLDKLGQCIFVNDRWTSLTGQSLEQALGYGYLDIVNRKDQLRLRDVQISGDTNAFVEIRIHPTTGGTRTVVSRWSKVLDEGQEIGSLGTLTDVTEQRTLEAQLIHQATHDELTGLANRSIISEHLAVAVERGKRFGEHVSVVFCDLDRFKMVNDSLGHDVGDRLLVAVSDRLKSILRTADVLGRFSGDEFVLIASGSPPTNALRVAHRVLEAFADPFDIGIGRPYQCTASVGVACSTPQSTGESLLRDADLAMYKAKSKGRGCAAVFDEAMRSTTLDRYALETDLKTAAESGELTVLYQPIITMLDEETRGVEALVRWDHPTRGRLSPELFIPIAEETGVILDLGEWVLDRACREIGQLPDMHLNVNLSAGQVHDEELVSRVARVLANTGFDPARLTLEITESVLVSDTDATIDTLNRLKALGISIAVDDFGTGYSSLNYLSRFPLDSLKVDRSFVSGMGETASDGEIVRAVINLAHALGLRATAEGVETAHQRDQLEGLGCDHAQGFLFDRPLEFAVIMQQQAMLANSASN
jgi:diguanylate cyclase (GGDEF)-like protein/PAS domain S-box-containing protein